MIAAGFLPSDQMPDGHHETRTCNEATSLKFHGCNEKV